MALLDRILRAITAASVLVLPISLLLFLQWPLRDLLQAYSREANDLAQWLFALYVSVAVTYATRMGTHLAANSLARKYSPATPAWLSRLPRPDTDPTMRDRASRVARYRLHRQRLPSSSSLAQHDRARTR